LTSLGPFGFSGRTLFLEFDFLVFSSERISFGSVQEQAWIFVLHEFN